MDGVAGSNGKLYVFVQHQPHAPATPTTASKACEESTCSCHTAAPQPPHQEWRTSKGQPVSFGHSRIYSQLLLA